MEPGFRSQPLSIEQETPTELVSSRLNRGLFMIATVMKALAWRVRACRWKGRFLRAANDTAFCDGLHF